MPDLTVESRQVGEVTIIAPKGFINAHTVRLFEQALQEALDGGHRKILINGEGLAYIASAGLGVIMGLIEDVRSRGGDIRLAELNDTVRNIFEVLGFNHLCKVLNSEREGVDSYVAG
ncbi:MAG TPA: STAS domain-containing protein [Vicinamibacteria bacterium]|nr:STAS domain-containing protein [Vicinamibacteria bacterium]